jgi:hypothetical protein
MSSPSTAGNSSGQATTTCVVSGASSRRAATRAAKPDVAAHTKNANEAARIAKNAAGFGQGRGIAA